MDLCQPTVLEVPTSIHSHMDLWVCLQIPKKVDFLFAFRANSNKSTPTPKRVPPKPETHPFQPLSPGQPSKAPFFRGVALQARAPLRGGGLQWIREDDADGEALPRTLFPPFERQPGSLLARRNAFPSAAQASLSVIQPQTHPRSHSDHSLPPEAQLNPTR